MQWQDFAYNNETAGNTRQSANIKLVHSGNQWSQTTKVLMFTNFVCYHYRYKLCNLKAANLHEAFSHFVFYVPQHKTVLEIVDRFLTYALIL